MAGIEATTPAAYVTFALPLNMKLIMKLLCKILFNEFGEREREVGKGEELSGVDKGLDSLSLWPRPLLGSKCSAHTKKKTK